MVPRVIDLYCGTGGFAHGFVRGLGPGSRTVLGLDFLPVAMQTFALNHPRAEAVCDDILNWPPDRVARDLGIRQGEVDVIIGGPPCQGFSSIRPHRSTGRDDQRNGLYQPFSDFVAYYRPAVFVMENVVGLATHDGGATIQKVERSFRSTGYHVDWKILNAADFGVPQRRERLIMIGSRESSELRFPDPTHRSQGGTIGHRDRRRVLSSAPTLFDIRRLPRAVSTWDAISDLPPVESGQEASEYDLPPQNAYQGRMRQGSTTLSLHRSTAHSERMLEIIRHSGPNRFALPPGMVTSGFSTSYSRIESDIPCVTLTVNFVFPPSNKCIHPFQDRALTPREGARIQSFEDAYRFAGNWSQIVKQIGNAVPPLLGEALGRAVAPLLGRTLPSHPQVVEA